jgi:drug/metabolite transporter (DMT)-like permease
VAYVLPVVGIALGVLVAGETVDGLMLIGTALVIGGIALVNARRGGGVAVRAPQRRSEAAT